METIKYQEVKKNKKFQQGIQNFKEGKCGNQGNVEPIWVKKIVNVTDYKKDYRDNSSYCFLEKTEQGISLGFCVVNQVPQGCELLTNEEAVKVNDYRQAMSISPLPLVKISVDK